MDPEIDGPPGTSSCTVHTSCFPLNMSMNRSRCGEMTRTMGVTVPVLAVAIVARVERNRRQQQRRGRGLRRTASVGVQAVINLRGESLVLGFLLASVLDILLSLLHFLFFFLFSPFPFFGVSLISLLFITFLSLFSLLFHVSFFFDPQQTSFFVLSRSFFSYC